MRGQPGPSAAPERSAAESLGVQGGAHTQALRAARAEGLAAGTKAWPLGRTSGPLLAAFHSCRGCWSQECFLISILDLRVPFPGRPPGNNKD